MGYQSEINVLRLMIKLYEERGGGYSQKEALKCAIKCMDFTQALKSRFTVEKVVEIIKKADKTFEDGYSGRYKRHIAQAIVDYAMEGIE